MILEYTERIVQLLANVIALMLCLFRYIRSRRKDWMIAAALFLCSVISCYYWMAYVVITSDYPQVSNFLSYAGWSVSFFLLLLLHSGQRHR